MASSTPVRTSSTITRFDRDTQTAASMMSMVNRPAVLLRPISCATSIDASDVEDLLAKRRSVARWEAQARRESMLMRTMEEEVDEVSDAESFDSLSSRAKLLSDMLSDSDSSIDENHTMTTISSEGPGTPRSPAPEYNEDSFPIVEIQEEKSYSGSMEPSPTFAERVKEMTTVGPVGPHLFRPYSTGSRHSMAANMAPITIPSPTAIIPPTPTRSKSSPNRIERPLPQEMIMSPTDSEPPILPRPQSLQSAAVSDYDIEEVRSWTTQQVCSWMTVLGFDGELVSKFHSNDITGAILIDLKWSDLKELDIQSFGKRIELWTEIHHLRARTMPTPTTPVHEAEFVRPSSRVSRSNSLVHQSPVIGSPHTRNISDSSSAPSQMMVVREVGNMGANDSQKVLPDMPTLLPRRQMSRRVHDVIAEADEETTSSRSRSPRPRQPLRRKAKKTNVRIPRRQVSVDSIIITSEDGEDFHHAVLSSMDDSEDFVAVRPSRRANRHRDHSSDSNSGTASGSGSRKHRCKKHGHHHHHHHHHRHHHHRTDSEETTTTSSEPRRHRKCSKGDRCKKHHGKRAKHVVSGEHGTIVIATTPSIADINSIPRASGPFSAEGSPRPGSVSAPSVLASSDVLGPVISREVRLQEHVLQEIQRVDPMDTVASFLTSQHLQSLEEHRSSPPPVPTKSPQHLARAHMSSERPQLSLNTSPPHAPLPHPSGPSPIQPPTRTETPSFGLRSQGMERAQPPPTMHFSTPSRTRTPMIRTTTPFSEADVPAPAGSPIDVREYSSSVPPEQHLRRYPTPTLESLMHGRRGTHNPSPLNAVDENAEWEDSNEEVKMAPSPNTRTHSGWMKKRRTHWFRHEWPDYHFVLRGTHLGYAKDVGTEEVGHIDMDNYQVACSNSGSTKLGAAFRATRIFGKKGRDYPPAGSYFFQLVPAADCKDGKKKAVGKAHHFSVGSREERIDWMRELMLAKAIKQKKQGFEVEVNGERM